MDNYVSTRNSDSKNGAAVLIEKTKVGCDQWQRMKSFPEKLAGKLKPNKATLQPWKDITTDFITGLPEVQGFNALFVTCCSQAHIVPTHTTTSARGLAALFRDHVWKLHGLSKTALAN